MPTVSIPRDPLFAALGRKFTDDEFQDLCFEFGIELDEAVEEPVKVTKTRGSAQGEPELEVIYKIEVPANRYDILCLEGLSRALNVFLENTARPEYTHLPPPKGGLLSMTVEPATAQIRPFIVCAVLRDCTFDERSYNSFLDLQDRMHHNVCRRRTLVAIGTHDLDTLTPPFRYRALPPKEINFVPLAQERAFDAEELFAHYGASNSPLKKFLPILEGSPVYPVVMDAADRVLSLPPIINGEHSRIGPGTRNVLIECTCTDYYKGLVVLNTMVAMFSQYSAKPFSVEPMTIHYPNGESHNTGGQQMSGKTETTPSLTKHKLSAKIDYIQRAIGLTPEQLPKERIPLLLHKMMVRAACDALPPHGHRMATAWPSHGQRMASALPPHCHRIATALPLTSYPPFLVALGSARVARCGAGRERRERPRGRADHAARRDACVRRDGGRGCRVLVQQDSA
jgi:phenylalanyl-tRNA synthetase beta chain